MKNYLYDTILHHLVYEFVAGFTGLISSRLPWSHFL